MNGVYPFFKFGVCLVFLSTKKSFFLFFFLFFFPNCDQTGRWFHSKPQLRVESLCLCLKKEYTAFSTDIHNCQTTGFCRPAGARHVSDGVLGLHRSEHLPAQLWNWLCLCMICFWMKVADTRTRPGVSPLCCSPQQACCSDSSRTKRYLIEPLFSVTGCLTYSFITFIKRKHCFQELQRVFNFYRMTVFSPVMTCMCLDLHWEL